MRTFVSRSTERFSESTGSCAYFQHCRRPDRLAVSIVDCIRKAFPEFEELEMALDAARSAARRITYPASCHISWTRYIGRIERSTCSDAIDQMRRTQVLHRLGKTNSRNRNRYNPT